MRISQLVLSRDVIFDELATWNWDDNEPQVVAAPGGVSIMVDAHLPTPRETQSRIEGESSSTATSSDDSDSNTLCRYRSLTDIYGVSNFV